MYPPINRYEAGDELTLEDGTVVEVDDYKSHGNSGGYADPGVGGFIPQLRYSADDPARVNAARSAVPSTAPTLPAATEDNDEICFIVTAVDLLGNESGRPSTTSSSSRGCGEDKSLPGRSIRAGVDITAPTAEFARSGLDEDARKTDDEFAVNVEDERDGSGINEGDPFIASLSIRNADGTQCIIDGEPNDSARLCDEPFADLDYDDGLVTTKGVQDNTAFTGYYTFTGQAHDKAGNLSEEISRVALSDETFDARASLRVARNRENPSEYTLDITVDDDLSVRDGYLALTAAGLPGGENALPIRLGNIIQIDPYNSPRLTTELVLSEDIRLPFLGLQNNAGTQTAPSVVGDFQVYVRDQREDAVVGGDTEETTDDAYYVMEDSGTDVAFVAVDVDGQSTFVEGLATGVLITLDVDVDGVVGNLDDGDDVTLTATVTPDPATNAVGTLRPPPFKRVYFYALSTNATTQESWRLIDSLGKTAFERRAALDDTYDYEVEIDAGDYYALVDDSGGEDEHTVGMVIAIGVKDDYVQTITAAVPDNADTPAVDESKPAVTVERMGVVGLVSNTGTPQTIATIDEP